MKKRFRRRRITFFLSLALFAVVTFYFLRDLRLSGIDLDIPDIVVENIEINREINGNKWLLVSPRVEHRQGMIYGQSLDVTITDPAGLISKIFAANGEFSRESENVTLLDVSADIKRDDRDIQMKSGRAYYDSEKETWYFSNDVMLSDGSVEVSGPEGFYDVREGLSQITGGGTVTWQESS